MATIRVPLRRPRSRLGALLPVFIVTLALGGAMAGCSSDPAAMTAPSHAAGDVAATMSTTSTTQPAAAGGAVPMGSMTMPTGAEVTTAWGARPAYVTALPADAQAAYAFALARPDVLQWLPCYCGCAAMDHRSNLDCFFQRREVKGTFDYEEHASFCDICIETANLASEMLRQGSTMTQIRAAVDDQLGTGAAPGTVTPLPPAS